MSMCVSTVSISVVYISVLVPLCPAHKHQVQTPDTPTAPLLCSKQGISWPPAGRRPGSAGGHPGTTNRKSELHVHVMLVNYPLNLLIYEIFLQSVALCIYNLYVRAVKIEALMQVD